jgi:hypothetical protein
MSFHPSWFRMPSVPNAACQIIEKAILWTERLCMQPVKPSLHGACDHWILEHEKILTRNPKATRRGNSTKTESVWVSTLIGVLRTIKPSAIVFFLSIKETSSIPRPWMTCKTRGGYMGLEGARLWHPRNADPSVVKSIRKFLGNYVQ